MKKDTIIYTINTRPGMTSQGIPFRDNASSMHRGGNSTKADRKRIAILEAQYRRAEKGAPCKCGEHDWHQPHAAVGGHDVAPGVWGNGGQVNTLEGCGGCGAYRAMDGLLRRAEDYPADTRSLRWLSEQRQADRDGDE